MVSKRIYMSFGVKVVTCTLCSRITCVTKTEAKFTVKYVFNILLQKESR